MVAEKEEKVVDRAEDSLTEDKKPAVTQEDSDTGKVYIQNLNISSDATTVKTDNTPYWVKALKVIFAFAVLWGFDGAVYALFIVLTIETGDTILYVYFGVFVVLASLLTFAVLYGMRMRDLEAESAARKMRQESGIVEAPRMRSLGGARGVRAGAVAVSVGRSASLQQPAVRATSKVQFTAE